MLSVPYSRYIVYPVPWYSFLIVAGAALAIILSCREERRAGFPKDTVIDLALRILPFGIIGARIYYVLFSLDQFRGDPLSVFRIWEGGIAIYGGVIAGFIVLVLFSRRRKLSVWALCDLIVPGLVLAQSIGRWGNWFNIEAYGFTVTDPSLCFFPFAVQVPSDGNAWHLAAFFYESVWDFSVFLFLMLSRRRFLRGSGNVFMFYLLLYASGRLVIEELRTDSLYAASSVRVSQLLSILLCLFVVLHYAVTALRSHRLSAAGRVMFFLSALISIPALLYSLHTAIFSSLPKGGIILFLSVYSLLMIICLFVIFLTSCSREVSNADNKA